MRYAFFPGCLAQTEQYSYELSVREVLPRLGVDLVDLDGASCCGFPSYSITSPLTSTYLTARNLALAEKLGLDLLTLCNNCNLTMFENIKKLSSDGKLKESINETLSIEGFAYDGDSEVVHIMELLHDKIGTRKIGELVVKPIKGLKFAPYPGCHAYRPSELKRPDDSIYPNKLDKLIWALGAETSEYPEKFDCCGSGISRTEEEAALKLAGSVLRAVKDHGFDGLVTLCPHCFKMLDGEQKSVQDVIGDQKMELPVIYYTQLLGLALGIPSEKLGLNLNLSPVEGLQLYV